MPEILLVLFLIMLVQACIRMGFANWIFALACIIAIALLNFLAYPFIVNQGNTYVAGLFANKMLINNLVLLVVAESILFFCAGFGKIHDLLNPADKSQKWFHRFIVTCWVFPGFSVLLATFYFQHLFLLWVINISFDEAALFYAVIIIIGLILIINSLRYLLKHPLLRLESALILVTSEIVLLLALLNMQSPVANVVDAPFQFLPLITFFAIAFCLALIGYCLHRKKNNR